MTMLHDSGVHCWFNTEMDYIWDFARDNTARLARLYVTFPAFD